MRRVRCGDGFLLGRCAVQFGKRGPDDGGDKHVWNVGQYIPNYTVQRPIRQPSSYA
jgi:hypothetical protein